MSNGTGTLERLDLDFKLHYDDAAILSGDPEKLSKYILILVKQLQELFEQINNLTNLVVDISDGSAIYSQAKQADGTYPIGTWRLIQVDNDWQRQVQLTVGTWTFGGAFERPV